jgi:hypothetical protein
MVYKYITYIIYTYTKTYIYIYIYTHIAVVAVVAVQNGENPKPQKTRGVEWSRRWPSSGPLYKKIETEENRGTKTNKKKRGAGGRKNKIKRGNTTLSLKTDHQRKMYLTIKTTYVRINQIKLD